MIPIIKMTKQISIDNFILLEVLIDILFFKIKHFPSYHL
ncbi:hypothetical protein SCAPIOD10359 [Staphylococcus capitis]|nr:hypothetical protein CR01_50051 [Staphylococcus capitis CR01]CQD26018.1 hypothetical protein SCAPIOD10359 [Staphylococcus capitis]CQD27403.1 hypothetical protein SCAPIOD170036 [Staphylococcus capitis]CQD31254.1 hypothetical protein SCAPIOD180012 [Staphylococcus capitis]CRN11676.1 hypothetical protein BN151730102 [Staphylococcus capitis]